MQNKKTIIILSIVVIVVGAAAFIGGRMLNQKAGPLGLFGMPLGGGGEGMVSISVQITPAAELPTTEPETLGMFVERKDNAIVLATISMDAGGGGVVVQASSGEGEAFAGSPVDNNGPKVEVVTTSDTVIYLETTQPNGPPSSGNQVLQQTVAEGSLDDLTSQSFVTVWGRKSGDRIIAEVLFISNPVMFKRP